MSVGAEAKREVPGRREVDSFRHVVVKECGEDGYAAADYASAYFSGANRR